MSQRSDLDDVAIVGEAVLRDYPLRLWARQQEHADEVLREFRLLLDGADSGTASFPPRQLVDLAEMFSTRFGPLIDELISVRQARLDAGADRMDWRVPLPNSTPELVRQIDAVWKVVDQYCRSGDLLALARPAAVVALQTWATAEILTQFEGGEPTPWPGPH